MRAGDIRRIKVDDRTFDAAFLGRGRHATAFRADDTVYLFVHDEEEYMKEAVSMWCNEMPHVPAIKGHDQQTGRGGKIIRVYSMPFYPNLTANNRDAWGQLKTLAEATDRIHREKYAYGGKPIEIHGLDRFYDVINDTRGRVSESVTEALEELMNAGSNYGSGVTCEFGRRNIGTDDQGRIVFRDILYDAEKVSRERAARFKRARGY